MGYQGEKTPRHTDDNGCCLDDFAILFILPHDPLSSLTAEPSQTSIEWIVENTGHVSNVTDMIKSQGCVQRGSLSSCFYFHDGRPGE